MKTKQAALQAQEGKDGRRENHDSQKYNIKNGR